MTGKNQCEHGQLARVCLTCEQAAEIAQLRQYLDAAQRRASALSDEVQGLREALQRVHNDKSFDCLKIEKTQQYVIDALAARKGEA